MNNYKVQILDGPSAVVSADSHSSAVKAVVENIEFIEFCNSSIVGMWIQWIAKPVNQPRVVVVTSKL